MICATNSGDTPACVNLLASVCRKLYSQKYCSPYTIYKNGTSIGTATNTSFVVTGLSPSTTYTFTVAASDSAGISSQSSSVSVTTGTTASHGTPPGTYNIIVTGTASGAAVNSNQLTLTVN
jgi:chitinase